MKLAEVLRQLPAWLAEAQQKALMEERQADEKRRRDAALLAWAADARPWFQLPSLPPAPEGAAVVEGVEAERLVRLAVRAVKGEPAARRAVREYRAALKSLQDGRITKSASVLYRALSLYERAVEEGSVSLEEAAALLSAWASLYSAVHGRDAMYRRYEQIKEGLLDLSVDARANAGRYARARRVLVGIIKEVRWCLRELKRRRVTRRRFVDATTEKWLASSKTTTKQVVTPASASEQVVTPANVPVKKRVKRSRVGELREKHAVRLRDKARKRAEKRAAEMRRLKKAALKAALRRKKARALLHRSMVDLAPQVHHAVVETVKWGALGSREATEKVLTSLKGREHTMTASAAVIDAFGLHDIVWRLMSAYDGVSSFDAVVSSASDGGRDAEQRLLKALADRGVEVRRDKQADRKAGVDAYVIVDGVGVCLQITTQSWWSATTPTETSAAKRLVNGQVEVGPAVSKVQKDLEKFRAHYGDLPYLAVGVNVRMPFTPEQYADDVLRLLKRQASEGSGARIAFIAAPGFITFEEVQR